MWQTRLHRCKLSKRSRFTAEVTDKVGNLFVYEGTPGITVKEFLHEKRIPRHAAIVYCNDNLVSDQARIHDGDRLVVRFVGSYNLRHLLTQETKEIADNVVYTKPQLVEKNDEVLITSQDFSKLSLKEYVETTFVNTIYDEKMLEAGDRVLIGLSGGLDSVAMSLLFKRLRTKLPVHNILAVTIAGVPDADATMVEFTKRVSKALDIEHHIVCPEEIQETFHLKKPFLEILEGMSQGPLRRRMLAVTHRVVTRMIEKTAEELRANKIALGLEMEDLVATVLYWMSTKYRLPGLLKRKVGNLTYIYPLCRLLKREHTLYVHLTAPEYINYRPSGPVHIEAPLKRSLYFKLQDQLQEVWPGIERYLFNGATKIMSEVMSEITFITCANCCGLIQKQPETTESDLCDICQMLDWMKVLVVTKGKS
jgi:tRNA(Ile)-lysidine synthase TilS/MesJ/sulfur carrier protein ThiS